VREAEAALHEELARLPEKYRAPLVLCCLDGLSRDEAATRLGWSANQVKHGLEQGRELLRARLARRGIVFGLSLLTGALASPASASPRRSLKRPCFSRPDQPRHQSRFILSPTEWPEQCGLRGGSWSLWAARLWCSPRAARWPRSFIVRRRNCRPQCSGKRGADLRACRTRTGTGAEKGSAARADRHRGPRTCNTSSTANPNSALKLGRPEALPSSTRRRFALSELKRVKS